MLDIKQDIQSLTEFKRNTPEYMEQLKLTGRPLILTVNGKAEVVVQDVESYQEMLEAVEEAKTLRALTKTKSGRGRPAQEVLEEIRGILKVPADAKRTKK